MICRWMILAGVTLAMLLEGTGVRSCLAQQTPTPPDAPITDPKNPLPKVDDDLLPAQTPGSELGPAKERPGDPPAATGSPGVPFILPADRLPIAPSAAALNVEVEGPASANVNRPAKFKIYVKNTGKSPAIGVKVYDSLPPGLRFDKSEPPVSNQSGEWLFWSFDSIAPGAEKVITITATPTTKGNLDHAPTVTLSTGSRSRTMVKEPKLKVEINQNEPGPVLKGKVVTFTVRVTNLGDGPAKTVKVHAKLSPGLKQENGSELELPFKEVLGKEALMPAESETISLEVDAAIAGKQSCEISATSPDVVDSKDATAKAELDIIEPKITIQVKGPEERHTDTVGQYRLIVTNPGTAVAKNARAAAELPPGAKLSKKPDGAEYIAEKRMILWRIGELDPGAKKEFSFEARLGGVGIYKMLGAAQIDGAPRENDACTTQVTGIAMLKVYLTDSKGVLDVGEETIYEIQVKNLGTKEASKIVINAKVNESLEILDTSGVEAQSSSPAGQARKDAIFKVFDLPPNSEQVLTVRAKAVKPGAGKCTVSLVHEDIEHTTSTTTRVYEAK